MPSEEIDDYEFEQVCDLVLDKYHWLFEKTKRKFKGTLEKEEVIQSASATVWINATKEVSTVKNLLKAYKDKKDRLNVEAIPSPALESWKWHFRDFIKDAGPRLVGTISYYISIDASPEVIERNVTEKYYNLMSEKLSSEELKALEIKLFGEN